METRRLGGCCAIIDRMAMSISPKVQRRIDQRVAAGNYASVDAVLTAALASLEQQEHLAKLNSTDLAILFPGFKRKIAKGLAEAKAGKLSDGESFFDELERQEKRMRSVRKTA
jgi:Arc/MetJ-type ribon-helix-helix transcriptional regulator